MTGTRETGEYVAILDEQVNMIGPQVLTIARKIFDIFNPRSVVDFGCGAGLWLLPFLGQGCTVCGVDGCGEAGRYISPFFVHADLRAPFDAGRRYDLALCIEVAEHLPAGTAKVLIETLAKSSDVIVFSAAIPGQGGFGHANEQRKEYWLALFDAAGYRLDDSLTKTLVDELSSKFYDRAPWLRTNMMVMIRKGKE